jgi:drug/metabolite transporter (DMT)-like permease
MVQAVGAMAMVGGAVTASGYLADTPLFAAQAVRYILASVVLIGCGLAAPARFPLRRPRGRQWWWLTAAATSGLSLYNVAVVRAVERAEPAVIGTVIACVPLVLAIGTPLVSGRRIPPGLVGAAALVVVGAALMQGGGHSSAAGVGLSVVALAGEAGFTLLALPVLGALGAYSVATHTAWIAALQLAVLAAIEGGVAGVPSPLEASLAIAYLVVATAAAFVLWFLAVESIGGESAGLAAGVIPIAAALTGLAAGTTTVDARVGIGVAVVVLGIAAGLRFGADGPRPQRTTRPVGPSVNGGANRARGALTEDVTSS